MNSLAASAALRRLMLGLALSLAAGSAAAAESARPAATVFEHALSGEQAGKLLGPAAGALKSAALLRGSFTQRKFLKELPQPLASNGEFVVARGLGVDWHTLKPFDATVVLTPQAMIQRGADGSSKRIAADQQPGLRAVGEVFDALFSLDLAKLGDSFQLYGEASGKDAWTLGLVPREAAFAKLIERIQVSGSTQPQHIVLFEGSGDRTEIDFGPLATQREIGEADRRLFAP